MWVKAGFRQKFLNPIYVHTRTLFPPIPLRSKAQQKLPSKGPLVAIQRDATPSRASLQRPCAGAHVSSGVAAHQVLRHPCRQRPLDPVSGVDPAEHPLPIRSLYVLLVVLLSAWVLGAALRLSSELAG